MVVAVGCSGLCGTHFCRRSGVPKIGGLKGGLSLTLGSRTAWHCAIDWEAFVLALLCGKVTACNCAAGGDRLGDFVIVLWVCISGGFIESARLALKWFECRHAGNRRDSWTEELSAERFT
jgi:hypothetical protein